MEKNEAICQAALFLVTACPPSFVVILASSMGLAFEHACLGNLLLRNGFFFADSFYFEGFIKP